MAKKSKSNKVPAAKSGRVSPGANVPTSKSAMSLIGGRKRLDQLHSKSVRASAVAAPTRLQLAIAIAKRHYVIDTDEDLRQDIKSTLDDSWEQQHMVWSLNTIDGPWAQSVAQGQFVWAPVSADDLKKPSTRGDFVEMSFLHLR